MKFKFDEDITSESEVDDDGSGTGMRSGSDSSAEDENETAQEKRLRIAKQLVASYEADVKSHNEGDATTHGTHDDEEEDSFAIQEDTSQRGITGDERLSADVSDEVGRRLHEDLQGALGKLHRAVASTLLTCDADDVSNDFYRGHDKPATCVEISTDGSAAWTGSKDCSIIRWDVETGKRIARFPGRHITKRDRKKDHGKSIHLVGHSDEVLALAASMDGQVLASGGRDRTIRLWDARSNKLIQTFSGHRDAVSTLAFQHFTQMLYSGSHDRTVKMWNMAKRAYLDTLYGHQAEITGLACLQKERVIT